MPKKIRNIIVRARTFLRTQNYYVHPTAIIWNKPFLELGYGVDIWEYVIIRATASKVTIGEYTQVGPHTVMLGGSGISIGKNVLIAPHCVFASGNHDYIQVDVPMQFAGNLSDGPISIGDDVWIGANCTITDGVRVGTGAVIGANSVVTKNVGDYDVVAGVPARRISNRKMARGRPE